MISSARASLLVAEALAGGLVLLSRFSCCASLCVAQHCPARRQHPESSACPAAPVARATGAEGSTAAAAPPAPASATAAGTAAGVTDRVSLAPEGVAAATATNGSEICVSLPSLAA